MRVRLKGYGSLKPPDYLEIPVNGTVGCLKKMLSNSLSDPSVLKDQHLVCGGIVLRDDSLSLSYLKPEESIVCLLPPSTSILRNALEVHDWIRKIVDLQIHFEPSEVQSDKRLVKLLKVFVASLTKDYTTNLWKPSDAELQDLNFVVDVLENDSLSSQTPQITWFREYGCALLSRVLTVDDVKLTLICLDQWSFSMLSSPTGRKHSAHPGVHSSVVVFIGTVRQPRHSHFIETTHILLKEAQKRTGEKRSAASNKQGHQRTPAMIQAIMVDALRNLANSTSPRGGFTDVGLHTGGKKRNVTWPLHRAVVQTLLESRGQYLLYGECTAQLYLWLAESAVAHLSKASRAWKVSPDLPGRQEFRVKVDSVMQVLRVAGQEAITLAETSRPGYDIAAFEVRCVRVRSELDEVISRRASVISRNYDLAPFAKADLGLKNIEISVPERTEEEETPGNLRKSSKIERQNLSGLPSPLTHDASWAHIDKWLQDDLFQPSGNIEAKLLACTALETYFYNKIRLEVQPVNVKDVEIIDSVVDKYRIIASSLRNSEATASLFSVDLLSREVLVVWCAFCIVHITASVCEPLLRSFSVALDEDNLGNLVLSEKLAVDAAIQVAKYIHKHSEIPRCLFSLRNHDETIEFAKAHARNAETTQIAWSAEMKNAKDRQDKHWKQVCDKKERLRHLDKELRILEYQRRVWQTILDSTVPNQFHSAMKDRTREEAKKEVKRYTSKLSMKQNQIRQIEQPPPPILQPLPRDEEKAMPILFFLMMPPMFEVLSRLSFSAQQMMLPSGDSDRLTKPGSSSHCGYDLSGAIYELPPDTEWHSYYMTNSTARSYAAVKTRVVLGSPKKIDKGQWYPSNVREYNSRDDGIWYPDALCPRMYWSGGGFPLDARAGLFFNPFRKPPNDLLIPNPKFTEKLAAKDSNLQWMLEQHGSTTPDRENWAEATHNEQPAWVSGKEEYLALGALRAYPHQQVRRVIIALRERTLSIQIPSVRTLLRQTLYHLGDISKEQERTYWRTDLFVSDGWKALDRALDSLAAELRFKSRDYEAVCTLGEIAAYASQWYPMSRLTSRKFAKAVRQWADDLAAEEENAEGQKVVDTRAKRSLLYMNGMVCYSMGDLSEEDVAQLIQLLFLAEYNRVEDPSPHGVAVRELTTSTRAIMARRIPEVLQIVDNKPQILTSALQLVFEAAPHCIHWKRIARNGQQLGSYKSISNDRYPFSVNLLTGVIMFDGIPLRRLPESITALPLYQRTFSRRNFEVVQKKSGAFQTVQCVRNCFYEFQYDSSTGRLIVRELYPQSDRKLELLDGTENEIEVWGSKLPIRLKSMHSHWLCRNQNAVLLRPQLFYERTVHYIIKNGESCATQNADIRADQDHFDETKGWVCYRIPEHRTEEDWNVLMGTLHDCDKLVVPNLLHATVFKVLQKFEPHREYIHTLLRPDDTLVFEIPRFNLAFELSEEGTLLSKNFQSFRLSQKQQLEDTLHDFTQYLVLEAGNQQKILIPAGVIDLKEGRVFVSGSQKCYATRSMHVYNIHERFFSFDATKGNLSVEARLQLAAIHASTSSMVPDSRFHKTGYQTTVDLLRQSWVNRPLTRTEHIHVATTSKFGILCPSVSLLCHHLDSCSRALEFLYPKHKSEELVPLDCDAATEYVLLKQGRELSPRAALTADEETEILGTQVQIRPSACVPSSTRSFECAMPGLNSGIISLAERELSGMISYGTSKNRGSVPFPLNDNELSSTALGKEMISELRRSWQAYQGLPNVHLNTLPVKIATEAEKFLTDCTSARLEGEKQIICALSMVPDAIGWHKHCFVIRRAVNLEPEVNLRDLGNLASSRTKLHEFNPFLAAQAARQVHSSIMKWLELCVIEDKMKRVLDLSRSGKEQELIIELQETGREWDVSKHPEWLVFEVEQQLQIRNLQYSEARFCMENPGVITQLNMGEGKTRVILPMLLLQLANRKQLIRLHFLAPLLKESYEFLHHTITASILCRRLYLLPFHRDVKPTPRDCRILLQCLRQCQRSQGAICLAPEHRLSLHLKWHELGLSADERSQKLRSELESISQLPYYDIFDESDEVLHHKYQLIYTVGNCIPLTAGKVRWEAAAAVLKQFQSIPSITRDFRALFQRTQREGRGSGIFDDIRIIPGKELQRQRKRLLFKVASGLVRDPLHHFRWLKNHPLRGILISFMTDRSKNLDWLLSRESIELKDAGQVEALLAFRGLLACGLMEHCLSRRFQVDYGIDSKRGIRHRVAVPYRASDTPSERAEYAQPDTLILFTLLAYYHGGISRAELKEATETLLQLGPVAQKAEYFVWFESAAPMMTVEQISALNNVDKLDPTSDVHLKLMHEVYRYNMAVINFWLGTCVFLRETMQFPQRLVANAFHLADNEQGKVVGFSGTKDNKLLLPLQVKQQVPNLQTVVATDGKMLELVLRNDEVICLDSAKTLSSRILEVAVKRRTHALIDTGATMAGLPNQQVALQILELLQSERDRGDLLGVVYFDKLKETWMVMNRIKCSWPLGASPIHERDAFVYFDESRCRGADMKLRENAAALLTLGPFMNKDKLMQGAGRMRKLDQGQRLIFTVPPDVVSKLHVSGTSMKSLDLLQWVMQNTIKDSAKGLKEWGSQGNYFCTTRDPTARLIDDIPEVKDLYANSLSEQTVEVIVRNGQRRDKMRLDALSIHMDTNAKAMKDIIANHVTKYGADQSMISSGFEEECEREIEHEKELETEVQRQNEVQRQIPRQKPNNPLVWDASTVLKASDPMQLGSAGVKNLSDVMKNRFASSNLARIRWDLCRIFVTKNFIETVLTVDGRQVTDLGNFMRPVDAMLVFQHDASCLLLSEWEADRILSLLWNCGSGSQTEIGARTDSHARGDSPAFVNLNFLIEKADRSDAPSRKGVPWAGLIEGFMAVFTGRSGLNSLTGLSEHTLAGLQLFAGCTMFGTVARKTALSELLPTRAAKQSALNLIALRGLQNMISRSDLELICDA